MKAQLLLPHPQLAPYIKHYYVLDFSSCSRKIGHWKPPVGFPVLQFHFGSSTNLQTFILPANRCLWDY